MTQQSHDRSQADDVSRRQFLGATLGTAATASLLAAGEALAAPATDKTAAPAEAQPKIRIGLVGCGGRGCWIGKLFQQHGGYEIHAVADYFQRNADKGGNLLGVAADRRFSGLSGYKKVIASGIDALVIKTPPYCIPEMAEAGVEAGLHVYMAKPVAVDVPGTLRIGEAGKLATHKRRVFLVDYQIPTDPCNIAVRDAFRQGTAGPLARVMTVGISGGSADPPRTANIESRLEHAIWNNDIALSGGRSVSYDIHCIDAAVWLLGARPIAAIGCSRIVRPNPHSDACDVTSTVFEYADGLMHEHFSQHLPNHTQAELSCKAYSFNTRVFVDYWGKALFQVRGQKPLGGEVKDLYLAGAQRNIAAFHQDIQQGNYQNPTAARAVDGTLTAILGREAAARRVRLTMDELLQENKRIEADLRGLQV
jgi:predicted dehydrogenase